jgi:hypothetical protein
MARKSKVREGVIVERGERGDREQVHPATRLDRRTLEHGAPSACVQREKLHAHIRRSTHGTRNGLGDVVQLQIEKAAHSLRANDVDCRRTAANEQLEPHLENANVIMQSIDPRARIVEMVDVERKRETILGIVENRNQ